MSSLTLPHAISPELALVDPELARTERARLAEVARMAPPTLVADTPTLVTNPPARARWRRRELGLLAMILSSLLGNVVLAALLTLRADSGVPARVAGVEATRPAPAAPRNQEVERRVSRWLFRVPAAALDAALVDPTTGLRKVNLMPVCRPSGTKGWYRCVLRAPGERMLGTLAVEYPAAAEGGALVRWLK